MIQLIDVYNNRKHLIEKRLEDFKNIKEEEYFYEFCYCVLTPMSKGKVAWERVLELKKAGFDKNNVNVEGLIYPIRFFKNKSKYLIELKQNFEIIIKNLYVFKKNDDLLGLREYMVENIKGYGFKEASHILRNIGHRDLAILDRHILKNLRKYNVINEVPKSLNKKQYYEIEEKFRKFADKIKIPMDHLDILFWSQESGEIFK